MELSRRSFLQTGSKVGLVAIVSGGIGRIAFGQESSAALDSEMEKVIPDATLSDPLYNITRAMFTRYVNTKFSFKLGPVRLGHMVLTAVEDMNPATYKSDGTSAKDCFALVFRGLGALPLQQGTYTVGHGKLGSFNLFIGPGDGTIAGEQYSAVINRLYP
jgi:hypothetical protein